MNALRTPDGIILGASVIRRSGGEGGGWWWYNSRGVIVGAEPNLRNEMGLILANSTSEVSDYGLGLGVLI